MKEDSCRHCGHELKVNKKCNVCYKENQFCCDKCGTITDEQIHFQCMMMSLDHTLLAN